jgi:hypothetical protein
MNYIVDIDILFNECPVLLDPRIDVVILHGTTTNTNTNTNTTNTNTTTATTNTNTTTTTTTTTTPTTTTTTAHTMRTYMKESFFACNCVCIMAIGFS